MRKSKNLYKPYYESISCLMADCKRGGPGPEGFIKRAVNGNYSEALAANLFEEIRAGVDFEEYLTQLWEEFC